MSVKINIQKSKKLTFGQLRVGDYFLFEEDGEELVCCKTYKKHSPDNEDDPINAFIFNTSDLGWFDYNEEVTKIDNIEIGVKIECQ